MKIEPGKPTGDNLMSDDHGAIPTTIEPPSDDEARSMRPPAQTPIQPTYIQSSLIQEFGDFTFLLGAQSPESIHIHQVIDDIHFHRDNYLNNNIKSIITYASLVKDHT